MAVLPKWDVQYYEILLSYTGWKMPRLFVEMHDSVRMQNKADMVVGASARIQIFLLKNSIL